MKKQFIVLVLSLLFFSNFLAQPNFIDVSQNIKNACELIYSKIADTHGVFIEKIEGSFYDDYLHKYINGCMFLISGTWSQLGDKPSPIDQISELLIKEGWKQNYEYSADGPDGTTFSLIKDGIWCIVHGRWDGGDDSDSTYVPLDNYQMIVLCGELAEKR